MPNFDISVDDLATISTESFSVDNNSTMGEGW
jgi:hypothetical protein